MNKNLLDSAIKRVSNFPKPGVVFYDITGILDEPEVFHHCIDEFAAAARLSGAEAIAAIEARGFIFAAPVAERCGLPLILVRKKGKLPGPVVSRGFKLEYGEGSIEVQKSELARPRRILVIDDLIATGGTVSAVMNIFREYNSQIVAALAIIGLPFLGYPEALKGISVNTLINYQTEK